MRDIGTAASITILAPWAGGMVRWAAVMKARAATAMCIGQSSGSACTSNWRTCGHRPFTASRGETVDWQLAGTRGSPKSEVPMVASIWRKRSTTSGFSPETRVVPVTIFEEYDDAKDHAEAQRRARALAKLTPDERRALGYG